MTSSFLEKEIRGRDCPARHTRTYNHKMWQNATSSGM